MKKIIAILLALVVLCSFAACGGAGNETTEPAGNEQSSNEAPVDATTPAQIVLKNFKEKLAAGQTDVVDIANEVAVDDAIPVGCGGMPIEEGLLTGFDNAEIKGFKSGAAFMPMIGTIPFIGYVFELEDGADVEAFKATLKDNANPAWNICTEAEETVCESEGNFVLFVMAPANFDEAE